MKQFFIERKTNLKKYRVLNYENNTNTYLITDNQVMIHITREELTTEFDYDHTGE